MVTKRGALVLGVALLLLGAWRLGLFGLLHEPAQVRESLLRLGAIGFVAYVLAFALLQPLSPLPGVAFMIGASLLWPRPVAVTLSLVGATLASVTGFAFARFVARDWVERRIPPRLRSYDDELARRGFVTVLVLRLLLWTNQGLNAFFGLSRVRFSTHVLATFLAYVPVTIAVTYLGDGLVRVLVQQPSERWVVAAFVIASAFALRWALRAWRPARDS
jgi:uncharacterized membrane protein YdjX (TVP38/TMEM64 family)